MYGDRLLENANVFPFLLETLFPIIIPGTTTIIVREQRESFYSKITFLFWSGVEAMTTADFASR